METVTMKLDDLTPATYNPRRELKPGDKDFEALRRSLTRFGQVEPLVWNQKTGVLISGHQRLNVLKDEGATEAEVVVVDLDEEQEKILNVALNKIEGDWDYEKLEALFEDINPEDIEFTGFTIGEIENLFGDIETEAGEVFDETGDAEPEEQSAPGGRPIPDGDKPFTIFLSFPDKELAQKWMESEGIEGEFNIGRNLIIKMEGVDYGKVN